MSDFRKFLDEQLEDPELKAEWDALQPERALVIFENAGPTCVSEGVCHEGAMSCGRLQAILAAKAKAEQKQ